MRSGAGPSLSVDRVWGGGQATGGDGIVEVVRELGLGRDKRHIWRRYGGYGGDRRATGM